MISGAQIMVKCLELEGTKVIFGYPGAAICPFYDELGGSNIRHILVRQEQNAGHAASGYARISGRVGVCVTTSGPGATNLITAIASAYQDSIPIVAITGQVSTQILGRDVFQEVDITGACEPFTKHSYLVKNAADLPRIFKEAFHIASTGRPGPVLIDVPIDVQQQKIPEFHYPEKAEIRSYKPSSKGHSIQIEKVCKALKEASRPVICAGGGIFSAKALEEFRAFVDKMQIPCAHTMMGIGVLPTAHPLSLGMLGTHGVYAANTAIHKADLILLLGARVGDRAMASPGQIAQRAKVVHIDIDPAEIGKNMPAHIPVVGDLKLVLQELYQNARPGDYGKWLESCAEAKERSQRETIAPSGCIEPKAFMKLLSEQMEENAVLVADVGQNQIWSANHFAIRKGRFLTSGGMGTMGYSLPAAEGAKLADPGRQVCAVCGDGSFQMQMMELGTMVQHCIPIKIVIMNNQRLGMVCELQNKLYDGNECQVDLQGSPDFITLAKAYGIPGRRICDSSEAAGAIREMLDCKGLYILECAVGCNHPSL